MHTSSPETGECFIIVPRSTYSIACISWGVTSQYIVCHPPIPPPPSVSIDHRHASPVHAVNKAVDKGHWNRGPYPEGNYTQICCSYRPWSHFIEFSLDFVPQVLYWIRLRTDGRSWHDSDVVLLAKVPGGSGSKGVSIVLLEHAILMTVKIWHNVNSNGMITIPHSRDAITHN